MSLNGVSTVTSSTNTTKASQSSKETKENGAKSNSSQSAVSETPAAVYESSQAEDSTNKGIYKRDTATINKLKEDAERRTAQLRSLVEKLLLKQGEKLTEATDIYQLLREGKLEIDPETAAQAEADIAEDGYWGVNQTSDRLVSFAIALSGGDPSKADLMIDAVKKGFDQATKAWGDKLPDICQRTLDATIEKLEKWKTSVNSGGTK